MVTVPNTLMHHQYEHTIWISMHATFFYTALLYVLCHLLLFSKHIVIASLCAYKLEQSVVSYVLSQLIVGCLSILFISCKQRMCIKRLSSTNDRSLTHTHIVSLFLFFSFIIKDKGLIYARACYNYFASCAVVMVGV